MKKPPEPTDADTAAPELSDLEKLRLEAIETLKAMLVDEDPKVRLRAAQISLAATRQKKSGVGTAGVADAAAAAEAAMHTRDGGSGGE